MKKFRIIGEGSEFQDNYGIQNTDVGGVRIHGTCVQRLSKDGRWYNCYTSDKPIKKILWTENGSIMAVTQDDRVQYANVNLKCNPNNKPRVRDYVVEGRSKPAKQKSKRTIGGSFLKSGWWWKWPLKGLWAIIKFVFGECYSPS